MKTRNVVIAVVIGVTLAGARGVMAQGAWAPSMVDGACGASDTTVKSKTDSMVAAVETPPAGKALVYVIEQMPKVPFLTSHVKVAMDGVWLAQLEASSFTSVYVDPGVHHFCARYQGEAVSSDLGATMLHGVHAEAGKTYYLVYRGVIIKDGGQIGFFDMVDEDEGRYLLEASSHMSSTVTKKKK